MLSVAVCGLLGLWFMVSCLKQTALPWASPRFHTFNVFGLLPNWSLFSSNFAAYNYELCVRYISTDGQSGNWIPLPSGSSRIQVPPIWNPERRIGKAYLDLALKLIQLRLLKRDHIQSSLPYLICLNMASAAPSPANGKSLEFGFFLQEGHNRGTRKLFFLSSRHPVNP